jgi:hypothetical protein
MAIWAIDLQRFNVAGTVRGPLVDGQTVSGDETDPPVLRGQT